MRDLIARHGRKLQRLRPQHRLPRHLLGVRMLVLLLLVVWQLRVHELRLLLGVVRRHGDGRHELWRRRRHRVHGVHGGVAARGCRRRRRGAGQVSARRLARRDGLADNLSQVLAVQYGQAVAVLGNGAEALQHAGGLDNELADAGRERRAVRRVGAEREREARRKANHNGRVVGHGLQQRLALDGGAHNVERGREAGRAEEASHLDRCRWVVDDAAVRRQACVTDEDFNVWRESSVCRISLGLVMVALPP